MSLYSLWLLETTLEFDYNEQCGGLYEVICLVFSHWFDWNPWEFFCLSSLELALQMCANILNFGGVTFIKTLYHFQYHGGEISCRSVLLSPT